MDLLEARFRWHRRFAEPIKVGRQLMLLSETESLLFSSPAVMALSPLLEQGISLRDHLRTTPADPLPAMLHALSNLTGSGHAQTHEAYASAPYVVPDFDAPWQDGPTPLGNQGKLAAWCLSATVDAEALSAWAASVQGDAHGVTLVLCDDLLDTRLAHVHAWHHARRKPWLLLKPWGEQSCVGPVFDPTQEASACWHCLAAKLTHQQAGRAWAQAALPIPLFFERGATHARLHALTPMATQALRNRHSHLHTWRNDEAPRQHTLNRRPQCPACGDKDLRARRQSEPIRLQDRPIMPGAPGGSRSMPPEQLVNQKPDLLSPLLGPLVDLSLVTTAGSTSTHAPTGDAPDLLVYRSAFIRPARHHASLPPQGFVQTCLGKGRTAAQSQASALGEAIERLAACWQGDEAMLVASAAELGPAAIRPTALPRVQAPDDGPPLTSDPFDEHAAMPWAPAWSLTHDERRYLPLAHCFRDAPLEARRHITWTSNGCAAGGNREEAILQGLLEVIERDATAIWWYARVPRPAWDEAFVPPDLFRAFTQQLGAGWQAWMLDLTHDLGVPVAAAVAHHADEDEWALGFGCHLDKTIAAERAMTELAQLVAVKKSLRMAPGQDTQFLVAHPEAVRTSSICPKHSQTDLAEQIRFLVRQLGQRGFDTIVLDHTRPDLPLHTVKVTMPGLCHIWPERVLPARLLDVPMSLGWLTDRASAAQWNPQALFV
jgi:bacteriocin biosynthesis cyclodehydratase domain-containing protein